MINIMEALASVGALIRDSHIVYTSGRHGTAYVNKDALYLHPLVTEQLCGVMAGMYDADQVDVVAGPTVGGVILAQWVARHLTRARTDGGEVLAVFAEEEIVDGVKRRVFRRGYDAQVRGKRVVLVEDIVTTGSSAQQVLDAVRALDATPIGLSIICNRSGKADTDLFDVSLHALATVALNSWAEDECPLCVQGVPVNTSVGKGAAFVARKHG